MASFNIIGGGILGASTAFHLAKEGHTVTLIDEFHAGQATGAGAGIIGPWLSQRRNKAWYALASNGAKYYSELITMLEEFGETDTGYKKVGSLHIHDLEHRLEKKHELALQRQETAPELGEVSLLSEKETQKLFPLIAEDKRAVHITGSARVNGRNLRSALIRASEKLGVKVVHGVAELAEENGVVHGAFVDKEFYAADKTAVTAGAWSKFLLEPIGLNGLVEPQKGQILHFRINEENDDWPVIMPPSEYYLLNFGRGHVVFGATREDNSGYDIRPTVQGVSQVLQAALEIAPGLKDAELIETRVGLRPTAPEFLPVYGRIPHKEGLYIADGLGASGLTAGPFLGKELALVMTESKGILDPANYPVERAVNEIINGS